MPTIHDFSRTIQQAEQRGGYLDVNRQGALEIKGTGFLGKIAWWLKTPRATARTNERVMHAFVGALRAEYGEDAARASIPQLRNTPLSSRLVEQVKVWAWQHRENSQSPPPTPEQAHAFILQVANARRTIAEIFLNAHRVQGDVIPDHLTTTMGKDINSINLSEVIEQLPVGKLGQADRERVFALKNVISKNLDVLQRAIDLNPKLRAPTILNPLATFNIKAQDDLKTLRTKAEHMLGQELQVLSSGISPKKSSEINAFQITWEFEHMLKTRPDVRIAMGIADPKAVTGQIQRWLESLPLDSISRTQLAGQLESIRLRYVPSEETLVVTQKLGSGGQGTAYLGTFKPAGTSETAVVIKLQHDPNSKILIESLMQASFHDNPHIPKVLGVIVDASSITQLVMRKVPGTDYASFLKQRKNIDPKVALNCFAGIARGLARMHELGFVHSDIKPANVILDRNTYEPRLIDFGMAFNPHEESLEGGTPAYLAPEAIAGDASAATDVYAMGLTLYALLTGKEPKRTLAELSRPITLDFSSSLWSEAGMDGLKKLIERCVDPDPKNRPTTSQMVQALNGEPVTPVPEGGMGLRGEDVRLLDVLRPESPFRQGVMDATAQLLGQ